ncbi:MAG: molybdopterin-dependent oxidoreductase, partial [Microlunatus sp.]|nr:molybdopterin-dependent oxidoreductase [Microlunatus sp.]
MSGEPPRDGLSRQVERALPDEQTFASPLRSTALTARLGIWLGIAFAVCFLTGLVSHFLQHPLLGSWRALTSPVWIYRVTQGVHVTAGVAAIPLLVIKLWSVAPKFWRRPLFGGPVDALERLSILVLVAAGTFQLLTGVLNTAELYAWTFFFTTVHYAVAWVAIGAIVLHIAVKLPWIRAGLGAPVRQAPEASAEPVRALSRRGMLGLAGGGAALAVITTIGDKVPFFSPVSVFSQRSGDGPQGLPVNHSAVSVGVVEAASSPDWRLKVVGSDRSVALSLAELAALPQRTASLPMTCVEGWSAGAVWTGVPLRDLLAVVGEDPRDATVLSLENGLYGASVVAASLVAIPDTLVALV